MRVLISRNMYIYDVLIVVDSRLIVIRQDKILISCQHSMEK